MEMLTINYERIVPPYPSNVQQGMENTKRSITSVYKPEE